VGAYIIWKLGFRTSLWGQVEDDIQRMLNDPITWRVNTTRLLSKDNSERAKARADIKRELVQRKEKALIDANLNLDDMIGYTQGRYRRVVGWMDGMTPEECDAKWNATFQLQAAAGVLKMSNQAGEHVAWFSDDPRQRHQTGTESRSIEAVETRTIWLQLIELVCITS
jgi:hypothetical protein